MSEQKFANVWQLLADRCEAATGPDQDIDQAIRAAMNYTYGIGSVPPFYTASVDAALRLVPEGRGISIDAHQDGRGRAAILLANHRCDFRFAATPALAVCAAALRARSQTI